MTASNQQGNVPAPVNQFGFPAGPSGYATPAPGATRPTPPRGGTNAGTWLVVAVLAIAMVGGGLLLFQGLGKTAQAGAQIGQQGIKQADDADVKQALVNAAQAEETWFSDHQNYAIAGHVVVASATTHVQFWSSAESYCLRAYSLKGAAQGPANGAYWWYDPQGGGLLPQAGPTPANAAATGACRHATSFAPLS